MILKDGVAIAAARSCDIQVGAEATETSSPSSSSWRTRLVGRKDWSVNVSMLVATTFSGLLTAVGSEYTLTITNRNNANDSLSGTAILTEGRITATRGSLAQGAWTFVGSGELV